MTKVNTYQLCKSIPIWVVVLAIVVVPGVSGKALAGAAPATWSERGLVEVQGGYFIGRRESFRDIYSEGVGFGLWYRRNIADRIAFGIKLSRIQLSENHGEVTLEGGEIDSNQVTHRDFAASATLTYELFANSSMRLFGGAGLGFSFRKITFDSPLPDENADMSVSETSPYGLLTLGGDRLMTRSVFVGFRVSFDHHFFGDPEMGDFGDTGGFNLGAGIGIGF